MTCIVGLIDDGNIYMGGDSAWVDGYELNLLRENKVFINSGYIFGMAGSPRVAQVVHYAFKPPSFVKGDLHRFMVVDFADALRECLTNKGAMEKKDNLESHNGWFLVGYCGQLFHVEPSMQVTALSDLYDAEGCGKDMALGSLYSTQEEKPQKRIKIALEAAERYSAGVRSPFIIKVLKGEK